MPIKGERRPRIVLTLINASVPHTFDGAAGYRDGTLQVACLAASYPGGPRPSEAVRAVLDNYTGSIAGTQIDRLDVEAIEDIHSEPLTGQAVPTFGKSITVSFLQQE